MKIKSYAIPAVWITAGCLSWWLYTYSLAGLVLPPVHGALSAMAGTGLPTSWIPAVEVLLRHLPEYLLGFGICLVLGRIYGVTGLRITGFITAANAIPFHYHALQFLGYARYHSGLPDGALDLMIPGLISAAVISPSFAVLGGFWGHRLRTPES